MFQIYGFTIANVTLLYGNLYISRYGFNVSDSLAEASKTLASSLNFHKDKFSSVFLDGEAALVKGSFYKNPDYADFLEQAKLYGASSEFFLEQ